MGLNVRNVIDDSVVRVMNFENYPEARRHVRRKKSVRAFNAGQVSVANDRLTNGIPPWKLSRRHRVHRSRKLFGGRTDCRGQHGSTRADQVQNIPTGYRRDKDKVNSQSRSPKDPAPHNGGTRLISQSSPNDYSPLDFFLFLCSP